ncbi:class I mannose-6-phosphate isomerase [Stieleria sp. ICT_E10.1]|uniref:type I phosphomannose isomerase catalytic subunit n=1 Tax=Stieleria sedimenti TaxID=2976331 RepID=UPI00217F6B59|nr:type I phosphomannose isomerase catalytic subunit [Stieleria sedimenti]MCS7466676.1 class I mannose-6-phosphate isomerase [Stieleria sedimenti]
MFEKESPYPLQFRPLIKQTLWGGSKLGQLLGKPIGDEQNYAESWEIVDHGQDQSVVQNGPLAGQTLSGLIQNDAAWTLGESSEEAKFPLLLKYLDCNRVLSVQVHPDDAYGATMDVPDRGKTEAWYVVDVEPGSLIYAGLRSGVDRDALAEAMAAGETDRVLHSFQPSRGDCVFIPAGTVHALGAGLVIAEIQQSSNTTFRLFDWNRVGADGNPRPLHIEQSLAVTDYQSGPVEALKSDPSAFAWQRLVACDKFVLSSLENGSDVVGGDGRFHILTVPIGTATLTTDDASIELQRGQSLLLPAAMPECSIAVHADSTVLRAE